MRSPARLELMVQWSIGQLADVLCCSNDTAALRLAERGIPIKQMRPRSKRWVYLDDIKRLDADLWSSILTVIELRRVIGSGAKLAG